MKIGIASELEILKCFKSVYANRNFKYFGFYNSVLEKIIVDESLMVIPMDDRTATRAHGVFDVIYAKNKRLINLDAHVDRLFKSAQSVSIDPPMSQLNTKNLVINVVESVLSYHLSNNLESSKRKVLQEMFGIRITLSSGYGDLGISSLNKKSVLYIAVFEPFISYALQKNGVSEFVISYVKQPKKLVHSKTIDYIDNAMMANQSKKRGGYQGIKALQNGVLLQAAMANIAFIFGKEFATPRFETVIEGTTIKKCLKYVQSLQKEGVIDKISFRDITIEEAYSCSEMMVLGGDKIVPVLNFNQKQISLEKGPITSKLQEWYQKTNQQGYELKVDWSS